jgi:Domain of unknown function (DUF4112)
MNASPSPTLGSGIWRTSWTIPVGCWSIGLDPLIGLIPSVGDLIGALISMVIVVRAVQAGIPRVAVARMLANITIDTLVGSIPVFGDAFDFAYKSNLKNLQIYEQSLIDPRAAATRHWGFFSALFFVVAAALGGIAVGVFALARRAFGRYVLTVGRSQECLGTGPSGGFTR